MSPYVDWLPGETIGAVCLSVDDLHPTVDAEAATSVIARLRALLDRHRQLKATLFVTPDWRPVQLVRSRLLSRVPVVSRRVYHVDLHPHGLLRLDRHPAFVAQLKSLPRTEVAPHGLHHVHPGPRLAVEFQKQTRAECLRAVRRSLQIFESASVPVSRGFCPPGWNLPPPLLAALDELDFDYVAAARDIHTTIDRDAVNAMSGLRHVSIVRPELIGSGRLVHVPVNFQATSPRERAYQIIESGGLLSIKAHAFKRDGGYTLLDGLDDDYCRYLDDTFAELQRRYGAALWWTSMSEIAAVFRRRLATPARDEARAGAMT